jgi:hypothetical protein
MSLVNGYSSDRFRSEKRYPVGLLLGMLLSALIWVLLGWLVFG